MFHLCRHGGVIALVPLSLATTLSLCLPLSLYALGVTDLLTATVSLLVRGLICKTLEVLFPAD